MTLPEVGLLDRALPPHRWRPAAAPTAGTGQADTGQAGTVRVGGGGLPLGRYPAGGLALADLFRPAPVEVSAFVDVAALSVLALRARAAGAQVVVRDEGLGWQALARFTRQHLGVRVVPADDDLAGERPGFERPLLVVDIGAAAPLAASPAWRVHVAVPAEVSLLTLTAARASGLALFGRLSHRDAALIAATWRLPPEAAEAFRLLRSWQLGVLAGGRHAVVDLDLTDDELHLQAAVVSWQARTPRRREQP